MKSIPLSRSKFVIVDDADYDFVNQWKWCFDGYAQRNQWISETKNEHIYMHRVIMNAPKGMTVDHVNGNKLDNRRSNLRICKQRENTKNRGRSKNNTSGYKGVTRYKKEDKWIAQITVNREHIYIGLYSNLEDAARAYDEAAIKHFGEYANLNFEKGK